MYIEAHVSAVKIYCVIWVCGAVIYNLVGRLGFSLGVGGSFKGV